jgi:hypothetical protein
LEAALGRRVEVNQGLAERSAPVVPASGSDDDLSTYLHRQLIGYLGASLPLLIWWIAGNRPTPGIDHPWQPLPSISAYYYTSGIVAFVGVLSALSAFLFTYRGYANPFGWQDRLAGAIAALAAMMVALFPTEPPAGLPAPPWWTPGTGSFHNGVAAVLFGSFIFFSLFLFTRSGSTVLPPDKRARNGMYRLCGVAMIVCVAWAYVAYRQGRSIFWAEALALECFALSWLVKGRAGRTALQAAARAVHYARHPRHLVRDVRKGFTAPR